MSTEAGTPARHPGAGALGVWGIGALTALVYALLAVRRHDRFETGVDLSIFSQAAGHLAAGRAPLSEIKGEDYLIFGDHLHPVIVLLGLPWRLWPDPRALLVTQALCIGAAVIVLGRLAVEQLTTGLGLLVTASTAVAVGVQHAALFDVHEVGIGVPLVAAAAGAFVRERYRLCAGLVALFPLVKEDMAVLMVGFAAALLVVRRLRLGIAVGVWAVVALGLAMRVVIPALNPKGVYPYAGQVVTEPAYLWQTLVTGGEGRTTLLALLAGAGILACRSPLVLAAGALLALRLSSSNSSYWGLEYHYSLLPSVVLGAAAVDGLRRTRSVPLRTAAAAVMAAVAVWACLTGPAREALTETPPAERVAAASEAVRQVPVGAEVAADDMLTPHLVADRSVAHISPNYWVDDPRRPEWMILDRRSRAGRHAKGRPWVAEQLERAEREGYEITWEREGYVVLRRR